MKRQIIKIDRDKCTGCGLCVPNCPEGALQIVNGKAELVGDLLCDGLGACIGHCPEDAILIEERESEAYDERTVMENVVKGGASVIEAHLKHLKEHGQDEYYDIACTVLKEQNMPIPVIEEEKKPAAHGGCPGARMMEFKKKNAPQQTDASAASESALSQWPVQLHLCSPQAPYFKNADLVIAADCVPFAFADFHQKFLAEKRLLVFCPKLDQGLDVYVEKLAALFASNNIQSLTIVHMEVPCCFGVKRVVEQAFAQWGHELPIKDVTITVDGRIAD